MTSAKRSNTIEYNQNEYVQHLVKKIEAQFWNHTNLENRVNPRLPAIYIFIILKKILNKKKTPQNPNPDRKK